VVPTFRKGRERWGSLACQGAVEVKVNINVKGNGQVCPFPHRLFKDNINVKNYRCWWPWFPPFAKDAKDGAALREQSAVEVKVKVSGRGRPLYTFRFVPAGESELGAEDHAGARGRHDQFLWHLLLDCHHGAEAGAVHGNQVVRVDLLQGLHGFGDDVIRIRGQVPPANHGVHFLDPGGLLDLAD